MFYCWFLQFQALRQQFEDWVVDIALIQAKSPKFMQVQKEMQDSLAASQRRLMMRNLL